MNNFAELNIPDIYDQIELIYSPFWKKNWFLILVIFFIFFLIFLVFAIKKFKTKELSVEQKVLKDLLDLKKEINNYHTAGQIDKFYVNLTRITKLYIDKYFSLPVIGATDEEVIKILKTKNLSSQILDPIADVFSNIEATKFNLVAIEKDKMDGDILKIITFVELTFKAKK